ncbi:phosphonate metabolism transcriptional regulator PhnF [Bosea sp. (in: a-proteobacteria)]|uniref:phosphonate metabolism transcriptional regulator PhnF n=1 Tax=Bosea sp. (in: a-proteobacteria) TaxID=1871050 RepID=UPI0033405F05
MHAPIPLDGAGQEEGKERGVLWKAVAASLREEIRQRTAGQQLATENGLAERFGVSRFTIRRALSELEKEGMLRIEHGRGLFVAETVIPYAIGQRPRFSENMQRLNLARDRQVLSIQTQAADAAICEHLAVAAGAELLRVETLLWVEGQPLGINCNHYPLARLPGLEAAMRQTASSTEALKRAGVPDYTRKKTLIIGRLPSEREARLLQVARSRPVLEIQKIDIDGDGTPICYGVGCHAADRIQFFVE